MEHGKFWLYEKVLFCNRRPIAIVDVFVQQPQSNLETLNVSKSVFARNELLVSKYYFIKVLKLSVSKEVAAVSAYNLIKSVCMFQSNTHQLM